ncbi:Piwi domain-containing protein [Xylaria bambusicola]|uniref:Piwi domain-containing protein n=1 Tax=Xylaria bambusicola TaxID=326684 RepID=UPI002007963F|nr:Piwi domain-containing protein [Xylaria bambusicola]KAI0517034.1 Piwi domain-containing protein [Xylaria bambusicola]
MSGSQNPRPDTLRNPTLDRVAGINLDGASDVPRGSVAGSHRGSVAGSHRGSVAGSRAGSPPRRGTPAAAGGAKPLGYDPGRIDQPRDVDIIGKRVDLPADAYLDSESKGRFTVRPGFNTSGKPIQVQLNVFPVNEFKDNKVYQYDVSISPEPQKASSGLIKKVWNSRPIQEALTKAGGKWLYDGKKLAWSSRQIERNELRASVDLDADKPNKVGSRGVYYIRIKQTQVINLSYLAHYLQGKVAWDVHVLEGLNFFDHCMRQTPSEKMIAIRRNFYPTDTKSFSLGSVVEARKGYYSAIRLGEAKRLMINVDTANTAFWQTRTIAEIALRLHQATNSRWANDDYGQFAERLKPVKRDGEGGTTYTPSEAFTVMRKLIKLKFVVKHRGKLNDEKMYTIKQIRFEPNDGAEGSTATNTIFNKKMPDGTIRHISVYDHYKEKYDVRLQHSRLPVIETTRGGMFPMELCNVADYQRYPFKLDPDQTSLMIKFAVTRPAQRKADIAEGFNRLNYADDPYLKEFGITVSKNMQVTNARLLRNPEISFAGNAKLNPSVSGRWDLRGKRFLEPNSKPITSWGLVVCGNSCFKQDAEAFASKFTQTYRNHGANIKTPLHVIQVPFSVGDYGEIVKTAWTEIGNKNKAFPEMLFFVVPNKNSLVYERIKKSMDCRWCCPSQVLQAGHVKKANAQYMSNVAMKVNAKLGGVTCKVASPGPTSPFFKCPTMIIGVDVSHAAPGSRSPSMAAMTVSMDKNATRYAGSCEVNGWRVELLQSTTCQGMFPRLLKHWISIHRTPPQHVYYFRDGVAEGSFQGVIESELSEIRRAFREMNAGNPKFTVIIATKRHHIRFFPKPGDQGSADRNSNPLPGTLVERDATHPRHFDFYLCSHVAIQGTARPVHYQVIYDDANVKPDDLQMMLYQQCYQYVRSTTPVSLHPAIYYAHLASNRARSHENIHASQKEYAGGKEGNPTAKHSSEVYTEQSDLSEPPALLPMHNPTVGQERIIFMNTTMWYI